jgi:mannonate dehydratase
MKQAWRWFGPKDPVTLDHVRQAGATDIVSALHHLAPGEAWTRSEVEQYRDRIETTPPGRSPLRWSVIESIPVPDDVKREGRNARRSIEVWIASLEAAAAAGLRTICYNFMPVLDWTRTDLDWPLPTGATALRFDQDRFAAFDLHVLQRAGAEAEYDAPAQDRARRAFEAMGADEIETLTRTLAAGLPGTTTDALDLDGFRHRLAAYRGIDAPRLRQHLVEFLEEVTPVAEGLGVKLTPRPRTITRPCSMPCLRLPTACAFAPGAWGCAPTTTSPRSRSASRRASISCISDPRGARRMGASTRPTTSTATSIWWRCWARC